MNSDLERMAREAGIAPSCTVADTFLATCDALQRFSELVRADERERCAKVCETAACGGSNFNIAAEYCAAAIRNSASRGAEGEKT